MNASFVLCTSVLISKDTLLWAKTKPSGKTGGIKRKGRGCRDYDSFLILYVRMSTMN